LLNLKEFLEFRINSVELTEENNCINSKVSVFFNNTEDDSSIDSNELLDSLRFRLIQVENHACNKKLYNSINTFEEERYFSGNFNINKPLSYKDDEIDFKFFDISFLEILRQKSVLIVENQDKVDIKALDFVFSIDKNLTNLIYYMCVYVDNEALSNKLQIKNTEMERISYVVFDTYIKNNRSINAKLKDYRTLNKINVDTCFGDKTNLLSVKEKILRDNIPNLNNVIYMFGKSRKNDGYNISFLVDLFNVYKNSSKLSFLLKSEKLNNLVLSFIKDLRNVRINIVKYYKNEEVKLISNDDLYIENDFKQNEKNLTFFSFYDENEDGEYQYEIQIGIKDVLPEFLKSVLDRLAVAIDNLQDMISKSNISSYYNADIDVFTESFYQDIYSRDESVLFKLSDLLIYMCDSFIDFNIDKLSILALINEKTLSLKTLNSIKTIFDKMYNDVYIEYLLYKTYNQLEFITTQKIHFAKDEVYYEILEDNHSKNPLIINSNELVNITANGTLKYFPGGELNNVNTYCFHSINGINFNKRKYILNNPISKTNVNDLNHFIMYFLYTLNSRTQDSVFYNEIFHLLFDEYLIFQKYGDSKESQKINVVLNDEKKTLQQQEVEIQSKIDLLFEVFVSDFFIKYKNLFDVWLVNKVKMSTNTPYQVSALLNSYINSELVYDNFQEISFLEKFIYIYLYKIVYKIEYFDFDISNWSLLTNERFTQLSNKLLICRFNNFLSEEFNMPFISELSFDLNNQIFIIKGEKITQTEQIRESYLDLLLKNKNIINVKRNINAPNFLNQKANNEPIKITRDVVSDTEITKLNDKYEVIKNIATNQKIVDQLNNLDSKLMNSGKYTDSIKNAFTKTFQASKSVMETINKLGIK